MTRKFICAILLTLLTLIAGACSSAKKTAVSTRNENSRIENAADYFSGITNESASWQQLKVPFNVSISQPTQISASGQAVMVRGKYINLSVRILGMEVAALYLTDDSILVVDRWNKRYISENLRQFLNGFPANISNLQDLLTGRAFVMGKEKLTTESLSSFNVEQQGYTWGLQPKQPVSGLDYAFIFSANQLLSMIISAGSTNVTISYGDPIKTADGTFASSIDIKADAPKKPMNGTIQWRWNKAEFGNSFTPRHLEKPGNYTRIKAADLLDKFKVQ